VHLTQQLCDRLHGSRALIPPGPPGRMVGTCLRAKAAALAGGSVPPTPAVADASTQMELLKGEAAAQTSGWQRCLGLSPGAGTGSRPPCRRCARGRTSCGRGLSCREADSWFQVQSVADPQPMAKQPKTPLPAQRGGGPIMQKNGNLQQQGPTGGRDFPTA